jgi:hypothetical protein
MTMTMTTNTNSRPGRKLSIRQLIELPLPPTERRIEPDWLRWAGAALAGQHPAPISGHVGMRIKVGLVEQRRELEGIASPLLKLLTEHRVIAEDAMVCDLAARWDRSVPAGWVRLEVWPTIAPSRIGAETRQRVAEAQRRRWAAAQAARAAA